MHPFRCLPSLLAIIATTSLLVERLEASPIVFSNPPDFPGPMYAWTSTYDPLTYGNVFRTFDSFSLVDTREIIRVNWQGFSFTWDTLSATSIPVSAFNIAFHSDAGGEPGGLLHQETVGFTQSINGFVDFFGNGSIQTVYDYSADLTGFTVTANATCWLSVQGITADPAFWTWTSGGLSGTSFQDRDPAYGGGRFLCISDRAFTLLATPEPATISLLMMAGAMGVVSAVARKCRSR